MHSTLSSFIQAIVKSFEDFYFFGEFKIEIFVSSHKEVKNKSFKF